MASGSKAKLLHLKQLPFGAKKEFVKDVKHFVESVNGPFESKVYKAMNELGGPGFKLEGYPGIYEK